MNPQARGRQFEENLHNLLLQTRCKIMREADIKSYFGKSVSGIDHLIYDYSEYIICIQDKWQSTPISISEFNHYSKCVEEISKNQEILNNPNIKIIAIYASNQSLSPNSLEQFRKENDRYKNRTSSIKYYTCNDKEESVILKKIKNFLHNKQIFMYEYDGDCIMRNVI
jgi:hypothetical protein